MSRLKNKVQLIGNLGKNPEVKTTEGGKKYARFSLATNETYKSQSGEKVTNTEWHNVICWGKVADIAEQYLQKGSMCGVEGKLTHRKYHDDINGVDRYYTEVVVHELLLLGKGDNSTSPPAPTPTQPGASSQSDDENDLPF